MSFFLPITALVLTCSALNLSSISAAETRCNRSVYETTQDLVYCVKNGINYDKTRRPKTSLHRRNDPVVVNISIEVASLLVDTGDMDFSMEFFFRQGWNDPNLAYSDNAAGGKKFIVFKVDLVKEIWTPDTYIYGIKSVQTVQTDSGVPASEGLRISPNGDVLYSTRLSMTLSCSMDFLNFPMDKQRCFLNVTSFFYTDDDLHYEWSELTVLDKNIAHFALISFEKTTTIRKFTSGNYALLTITFEFSRLINFYLLSWYLPATLIVALSWVSFWIDSKATPARVSLGIITILAMGSFLIGEQDGFPSVSYIRAIDLYLITCFVFVFSCLVEFAIVHYATSLDERKDNYKKHDIEFGEPEETAANHHHDKSATNGVINTGFMGVLTPAPSHDPLQWNSILMTELQGTEKTKKKKNKACTRSRRPCCKPNFLLNWAKKLDTISRLAFPLTFFVLSITYWLMLTTRR